MSRPLRIEYPGAYYHVMNRGAAYQATFRTDADREIFLEGLNEVHKRWNVKVLCYCLMGNHYHLCVQTGEVPLSRIMRHIDGVYTQRFNRRHGRDGPLFRGRYKAILIEADQYLLSVARYIHHNPVEARIAKQAEAYRWSSLRHYLKKGEKPECLETEKLLSYFKGKKGAFIEYMQSKVEKEIEQYYKAKQVGPILGTERFKEWIKAKHWKRQTEKEIPQRRQMAMGMDAYIALLSEVYEIEKEAIVQGKRGLKNESRQIGMYLCREMGGYSHKEIAKTFGLGSYSTVSSVCAVIRERLKKDKALSQRIQTVNNKLQAYYGQKAT